LKGKIAKINSGGRSPVAWVLVTNKEAECQRMLGSYNHSREALPNRRQQRWLPASRWRPPDDRLPRNWPKISCSKVTPDRSTAARAIYIKA
jgi:hypothetical protein